MKKAKLYIVILVICAAVYWFSRPADPPEQEIIPDPVQPEVILEVTADETEEVITDQVEMESEDPQPSPNQPENSSEGSDAGQTADCQQVWVVDQPYVPAQTEAIYVIDQPAMAEQGYYEDHFESIKYWWIRTVSGAYSEYETLESYQQAADQFGQDGIAINGGFDYRTVKVDSVWIVTQAAQPEIGHYETLIITPAIEEKGHWQRQCE